MIICAGEALIDMVPVAAGDGEASFVPLPGGAALNSAIALGRLGIPVGLQAGLSSDGFGDVLKNALEAAGVDTGLCVFSDRPTMLAFVRLNDGNAEFRFEDNGAASRVLSCSDFPVLSGTVSTLLFGGISLVQEPCGTAFEELMARQSSDTLLMLDPNIRPALISDETACRSRLERMMEMADIIKVSTEDLAWLGGADEAEQWACERLACGASVILITNGAEGSYAFTSNSPVHVPAVKTEVIDTVGAGDTFNAGFLAKLFEGGLLSKQAVAGLGAQQLREAMEYGSQAAAISVARRGADPPWADELVRMAGGT